MLEHTVTNILLPTPLATLQAAGIITAEHHAQALAHPCSGELPGKSSLADHLLWMLEHGIIDEEVLDEAGGHVAATCEGDERERYMAAIGEAFTLGMDALHKAYFRRLVHAGWITQAEYDRALAAIGPTDIVLSGPGRLLAWLIGRGIIDQARVAAIRTMGNPGGDIKKAQMLDDVARVFDRQSLWSPRGMVLLLTGLSMASLVGWMLFRPAVAPVLVRLFAE